MLYYITTLCYDVTTLPRLISEYKKPYYCKSHIWPIVALMLGFSYYTPRKLLF